MEDQHTLRERKILRIVSKGDTSVMEEMEEEMKTHGQPPKITANLALAKSLRKNIEFTAKKLEKSAYRLITIDWILFLIAALCMALISMGVNCNIYASFDLTQLLAAISFGAKSAEKSLGLSSLAKDRRLQVKELKKFIQRISAIELEFYINSDIEGIPSNKMKITADIQEIWSKFNDIDLKTFLAPPRPDLIEEHHEHSS